MNRELAMKVRHFFIFYWIHFLFLVVGVYAQNIDSSSNTIIDNLSKNILIDTLNNSGWITIKNARYDDKIFIDGRVCGGERTIELPVGIHRIAIVRKNDKYSKLIEIINDDTSSVILDTNLERVNRFAMSFEIENIYGKLHHLSFCHSAGIKIRDKHYIGISFGKGGNSDDTYDYYGITGGGLIYTFSFNLKHVLLLECGITSGFWQETISYWEYERTIRHYYFAGPKARLQVGYKYVFLMSDFTLLIGNNTPKFAFTNGISFIF